MLNEESKDDQVEAEDTARTQLESPKAPFTAILNESGSQGDTNGLNMKPVAWPFTNEEEEEKLNKSPSVVVKKRYSRR